MYTPRRTKLHLVVAMIAVSMFLAIAAVAGPTPPPWIARHGLSPSAHQKEFDEHSKKGFRLINVSGYVQGKEVRYATLWRKVSGPPWVARHGLTSAAYQKAFDEYTAKGYRLTWVNGFEHKGENLYAAIWEKKSGPAWVARHGLTSAKYQAEFDALTGKGYRLVHVSGYTLGGSARFAAIFEKSPGPAWQAHHDLSASAYQAKFDAYAKQGFRPIVVSGYRPGRSDLYAAIWVKQSKPPWLGRHGVPLAEYQHLFDIDYHHGYQPRYIEGFTSGSPRFNTLWESPFSAGDLKKISQALDGFTTQHGVAGLSVAIARDGKLLYATGHGLADKEKAVALDVHHRLRIGSISKPVTAAAIFRLVEKKTQFDAKPVTLQTKVFGSGGVLGSVVTVPESLQALEDATLQHFLEHTSGLPGGPDAVHCAAGDLSERIEFVLQNDIDSLVGSPGAAYRYSNLGYIILERVIEVLTGTSYESYVRNEVFAPSGITAARLFEIGPYDPASGEAKHYRTNGTYAEYAAANTCENEPPGVGSGGWATSAKDLLRFLVSVDGAGSELLSASSRATMLTGSAANPGYGKGWILDNWGWCGVSRSIEQGHNGGLAGGFSNFALLDDGFSFAVIGNQNTGTGTCSDAAKTACGADGQPSCSSDSVTRLLSFLNTVDWPNYNLF